MGLFDFLTPKWKSRNPESRLAAVRAMGRADLERLKILAAGDADLRVRLAALERIEDRATLEELVCGSLDADALKTARKKLDRILCEAAISGAEPEGAEAAIGRIEDPGLIERLAVEAPTPALRVKAVLRIHDQEALCRVVEQNCGKEPARAALSKIDDEALLVRIARSGSSKLARRLAGEKLEALVSARTPLAAQAPADRMQEPGPAAPQRSEPTPPETDGVGREAIAAVEALVGSLDEGAEARFREAEARWASSSSANGASPLAAQFTQACQRYFLAGERIKEERKRLRELSAELDRLETISETAGLEGKRTALAELDRVARRESFQHVSAAEFLTRLDRARGECGERLAAMAEETARARREALEKRVALCSELEELAEASDQASAGRRAKELRREWKELGPFSAGEARALEDRFRAASDRFAARQATFAEEQQWLRWNNRTLKEELCSAVEALDAEEDLAALAERVKDSQRRWKEIGPAPRAEAEALWERFRAACDRGFERCKPHFEDLERRRAESVERREELCREAEAHAESADWKQSTETLKRLQIEWKAAGPIPRRQDEELYARFRLACNRFFERRQAHFAELDESRRGNQTEKERLCARAESLAAEPDRRSAREFRQLQAEWKRVGPAPRETEQELWERFRGSCDRFFAWLDSGRRENLRLKEALCEEVEAVVGAASDTGSREIEEKLAEIQKRWMKIGPAPKGHNDAVWERFHKSFRQLGEARGSAQPGQSEREEPGPDSST